MTKPNAKSNTKPKKEKIIKKSRFFLQTFELHANLKEFKAGSIIPLECRRHDKLPRDPYWRRRLRDAEIDGCLTIYKEPKDPAKNEDSNE